RIPDDEEVSVKFSGIPWKKINDSHKRDYDAALEDVFEELGMDSTERDDCNQKAQAAYNALSSLDLEMKRKI
ncbi:MAG: hypothetical protein ACOYIK_10565, partial [Coriobacteriales bacterium]